MTAVLGTLGIAMRVGCMLAVAAAGSHCTGFAGTTNTDRRPKEARARLEVSDLFAFAPRHHETDPRLYQPE